MQSETRTALLDAAEGAARTRGFDGFSYADLATEVGIRKASIHHHFPTKAALSVALLDRYHSDLQAALAGIDAGHTTGGARLAELIARYRSALDGGKSLCLCVAFSASRESLPEAAIARIRKFREITSSWIAMAFIAGAADGSIAAVGPPGSEAAAMLSLLEGAQLAARTAKDPALFDDALQVLVSRLA